MRSCVTISLVDEARGGPFVFWDDLSGSIRQAAELGFDAVELFLPGPTAVDANELQTLLADAGLALAGVGTGAGWVKDRLSLTDAAAERREQAVAFIKSMIEFGAPFAAPAVIGSMQGRAEGSIDHGTAKRMLSDALGELGEFAAQCNVALLYEPLNRYETNLVTTVAGGVDLIKSCGSSNVRILADLFHMNIEESHVANAISAGGPSIGHIHFVDSNRQAVGAGHTDFAPIVRAIRNIGYGGFLSAEAFPIPDSLTAAQMTVNGIKRLFGE